MIFLRKLDLFDRYLLASIALVLVVVPAVYSFAMPDHYKISVEIWIGLVGSFVAAYLFLQKRKLPRIYSVGLVKPIFSTRIIIIVIFLILLAKLIGLLDLIVFADKSGLTREEQWYEKGGEITGRGMGTLISQIIGPFIFVLFHDYFKSCIRRAHRQLLILLFIMMAIVDLAGLVFVSLYRSPLVFLLLYYFIFWHFYIGKLKITTARVTIGLFLVASYLSAAAYYRAGISGDIRILHGLRGLSTASEIELLRDGLARGVLHYEYGRQLLYNLFSWVPRVFWEDKPIVSFSYRLSEDIFGGVGIDTWVRTFTVPGEGYLQFGVFGMVLWMLIFMITYKISKIIVIKNPIALPFFLGVWIQFPLIIRADLSAFFGRFWQALFGFIFVFLMLVILSRSGLKTGALVTVKPTASGGA